MRALKAQPLAEMRTIGRALEHLLAEVEALKARLEERDGGGEPRSHGENTGYPPSRV